MPWGSEHARLTATPVNRRTGPPAAVRSPLPVARPVACRRVQERRTGVARDIGGNMRHNSVRRIALAVAVSAAAVGAGVAAVSAGAATVGNFSYGQLQSSTVGAKGSGTNPAAEPANHVPPTNNVFLGSELGVGS